MYKVYIITHYYNGIPQVLHETESININSIVESLSSCYFLKVLRVEDFFDCIEEIEFKNNFFIYTSSQYLPYKSYINDVLLFILGNGGRLVPGYEIFHSHENKVFQALEMKRLGIPTPDCNVITSLEDGLDKVEGLNFPAVFKVPTGYASAGVELINDRYEAIDFVKGNTSSIFPKGKNFFRHNNNKKIYRGRLPIRVGKVLVQEFLENCQFDWKVLVFGDMYFVIKRYVQDGDFRASGSGMFDINPEVDGALLDFSRDCFSLLSSPFISMDIVFCDEKYYLIEYQGVHFGLYAALKTQKHYTFNGNSWEKIDSSIVDKSKLFSYAYKKEIDSIVKVIDKNAV